MAGVIDARVSEPDKEGVGHEDQGVLPKRFPNDRWNRLSLNQQIGEQAPIDSKNGALCSGRNHFWIPAHARRTPSHPGRQVEGEEGHVSEQPLDQCSNGIKGDHIQDQMLDPEVQERACQQKPSLATGRERREISTPVNVKLGMHGQEFGRPSRIQVQHRGARQGHDQEHQHIYQDERRNHKHMWGGCAQFGLKVFRLCKLSGLGQGPVPSEFFRGNDLPPSNR